MVLILTQRDDHFTSGENVQRTGYVKPDGQHIDEYSEPGKELPRTHLFLYAQKYLSSNNRWTKGEVTRVPSPRRINYALYEELEADDPERTRDVYRECLRVIPHSKFSFSKIWIMAAQFEIRQKNLAAARKILGQAIGRAPKDKVRMSLS
jgi:hypothetical protein